MLEDLEDGQDGLGALTQDAEGLFCASLENALCSRDTQAVYDVSSETEGNTFRLRKKFPL